MIHCVQQLQLRILSGYDCCARSIWQQQSTGKFLDACDISRRSTHAVSGDGDGAWRVAVRGSDGHEATNQSITMSEELALHRHDRPLSLILHIAHTPTTAGFDSEGRWGVLVLFVIFHLISRHMRPEGPWQRWWASQTDLPPSARPTEPVIVGPQTPHKEKQRKEQRKPHHVLLL